VATGSKNSFRAAAQKKLYWLHLTKRGIKRENLRNHINSNLAIAYERVRDIAKERC
jgi:hypothetical protein